MSTIPPKQGTQTGAPQAAEPNALPLHAAKPQDAAKPPAAATLPGGPATLVVALTGGIASGKSTVADLFAELGVPLVDTDALAHALTIPGGAAIPALHAAFGDAVLDAQGGLDRAIMRERAFSEPAVRRHLEAILHPLIRAAVDAALSALATQPYVLLAIPLLVETGAWRQRVGRVLVVDCPEAQQRERAARRPGLTAAQLQAILDVQATREERRAAADDLIDNSGNLAALRLRVAELDQTYRRLALERQARPENVASQAPSGVPQAGQH